MIKAIDKLLPGVVDARAMTRNVRDQRDRVDNWNLALGSARAAGCRLVHATSESLANGTEAQIQLVRVHLPPAPPHTRQLLWEVARVSLESRVKKAKVYLEGAFPKEKVVDLVKWPIEKILTSWLVGFCDTRKHQVKVTSLASDLKDGLAYAVVIGAITKKGADLIAQSPEQRLAGVVRLAKELGLDASAEGLLHVRPHLALLLL